MFKRLAKSGLADLAFGGFLQPLRMAQRGAGFSIASHSNDNLPGLRRPRGQRRIPTPALACHWFDRNGRLECRWHAETDDAPDGAIDGRRTIRTAEAVPRAVACTSQNDANQLLTVLSFVAVANYSQ
jgi:hypothetical protein